MPPPLLFLYGSLRRGEANHVALGLERRLRYLGTAVTRGRLFDLGPYPAFVAGKGIVHGELCEPADETILAELDAFEGFDPADPPGSLYVRETIALEGDEREAFVYRYNGSIEGCPEIAGGDWVAHRRAREAG